MLNQLKTTPIAIQIHMVLHRKKIKAQVLTQEEHMKKPKEALLTSVKLHSQQNNSKLTC